MRNRWWRSAVRGLLAGALLVLGASASGAATLADGDWTVEIDPSSTAGVSAWVDPLGVNHMNQEWFWFSGQGEDRFSVDSLSDLEIFLSDTDGDGDDDNLYTRYTAPTAPLAVEINYRLADAGILSSPEFDDEVYFASSLVKTITVTNLSSLAPIEDFSFWIYGDAELDGTPNDDGLAIIDVAGTRLGQSGDSGYEFDVSPLLLLGYFTSREVFLSDTDELLDFLNNVSDDLPEPVVGVEDGDLSFLFQGTFDLDPGSSIQVQAPQNLFALVPEPQTALLLGTGLAGLAWLSRRRALSGPLGR